MIVVITVVCAFFWLCLFGSMRSEIRRRKAREVAALAEFHREVERVKRER